MEGFVRTALGRVCAAAICCLLLAPRLGAQGGRAKVLGKTRSNSAAGLTGSWEIGGTDLTFKEALDEVWILDPYGDQPASPMVYAFKTGNLSAARREIALKLPAGFEDAPVLGIAEVTAGPEKGLNWILFDSAFGGPDPGQPMAGLFDDTGKLAAGDIVIPIDGIPSARLTSIDMSPDGQLIAAYDSASHSVFVLDPDFAVLQGPIPLAGNATILNSAWYLGNGGRRNLRGSGVGLFFLDSDHFLAGSGFYNATESRWVLEYDLKQNGAYTGRAIDLSAAGEAAPRPDVAFAGMDSDPSAQGGPILLAHNISDEQIFAFTLSLEPEAPQVTLESCEMSPETGQYRIAWTASADFPTTAYHIFENGVRVATLDGQATDYVSPLPVAGKTFVEVAAELEGQASGLRAVCQFQNSSTPPLPDVGQNDAVRVTTLGFTLAGVAVTKTPASPEEFRGYLIGEDSNDVVIFDHTLTVLETLELDPRVTAQADNLPAVGVAILSLEGAQLLAVLDPDGSTNSSLTPSATFHALDGPSRGLMVKQFDPIDMTALQPAPSLLDWDWDGKDSFIAGGLFPGNGEFTIVRLKLDGDRIFAVGSAPVPQRLLTPGGSIDVVGLGVTVLPSGNLLVAGADSFSKTYTEALLMTPFSDDPPGAPKLVGFAQGLLVSNQFFGGLGPGLGPDHIFGLDAAWYPPTEDAPDGIGVTYLPTGDIILVNAPSASTYLYTDGRLLVHGTTQIANPDLVAEQLFDADLDLPAAGSASTPPLTPSFATTPESRIDYVYYVINPSKDTALDVTFGVTLDGAAVPDAADKVSIPPGRYHRRTLVGRQETAIALTLAQSGTAAAKAHVLVGAAALGARGDAAPRFRRGDCDQNGQFNITDAVSGLAYLFQGSGEPRCLDACDVDDTGEVNLSDMIVLLSNLFRGGPPPLAPGPDTCGVDPTQDGLAPCSFDPAACAQ